ncbi:ABC transporter permease [Acidiferrimicrobium sp. IK]|uniref:ABC transporter permease n=1 Tax=Acidiferrimicrobium sp. IK TaxID=2871700 RepID=UPI0021CB0DF2|nr:ABC transporter permease [Acidiferrimicrobium sp. IK]MCU4186427.1 ABC transporter permease [Acidiferrimicrobium sp. IK]
MSSGPLTAGRRDRPADQASSGEDGGAVRRGGAITALRGRVLQEALTVVAFMVIFAVYGGWLGGKFFNVKALILDVHNTVPSLLLALAVVVTLIAGQFDLSVTGVATCATFLSVGLTIKQGWPEAAAVVLVLVGGVAAGLLNALLVVGLRVNTFIATLGTNGLFLGISAVYSGGGQVSVPLGGRQLPGWFSTIGAFTGKCWPWLTWTVIAVAVVLGLRGALARRPARLTPPVWAGLCGVAVVAAAAVAELVLRLSEVVDNLSWAVALLLAVACVLWLVVGHTVFGRNLRATGANSTAAWLTGVRTARVTTAAFVIGGAVSAVAGIVLGSALGSATPDAAGSFLLPAFAAAFLSTVLFSSGRFHVWGTVIGGVFLVWVGQGLISGGVNFTWMDVINGLVLISAVAISTTFSRKGRPT